MNFIKSFQQAVRVLTVLLAMSMANSAVAQNANAPSPPQGTHSAGDYDINYSVLNSLFIPADIAKIHGLVRAKDQALINISVFKRSLGKAVPAKIEGTAKNLMQQIKTVDFKTINEPGAIYYIGSLRHSHEETLHLDLTITPDGESAPLAFRLSRKFYLGN